MILGLFTGVLGIGGIERISCHVAAVLVSLAQDQGMPYCLLSLNDRLGRHMVQVGDLAFTIQGFGRSKRQFVVSALAVAHRTRLMYIGHPNIAPLGLLMKAVRPSVRYWVATYGIDVWKPLPLHRRISLRLADGVTALSKFTAEKTVATQKLKAEKIVVVPPALDPGLLRMDGVATPEPPVSSGHMLLTVARLAASERYKGVETVLEALPKVLSVVPDTYYVIVGDGDDRPRLERVAKELGVAEHVLFVGERIGDELAGYYKACDLFVMPSRKEGFGVVFLEAMAFAKPAIGGNHGGTPEVVLDGVTGFLVNYGDAGTLANRLIRLISDEDLRRRMGEAGRRRVFERYSFEHFRKRLLALLMGDNRCAS